MEKYKWPLSFLLLGVIFAGIGILGSKLIGYSSEPKIEILGESFSSSGNSQEGIVSSNNPLASSNLTVEAAGEVIKPGVYQLPIGSRVNDLLTMAGGVSAEADREWVAANVNLAERLKDGDKIYIPSINKIRNSNIEIRNNDSNSNFQNPKININTASESELDTLWGVGPATAKKIIDGRPYSKTEILLEKKIVKSNVWEQIKEKVTVY